MNNCREFFDSFAREKGIDPSLPTSWYSISMQDILSKKVGGYLYLVVLNIYMNILFREAALSKMSMVAYAKRSRWHTPSSCSKTASGEGEALPSSNKMHSILAFPHSWKNSKMKRLTRLSGAVQPLRPRLLPGDYCCTLSAAPWRLSRLCTDKRSYCTTFVSNKGDQEEEIALARLPNEGMLSLAVTLTIMIFISK